MIKMISIRDNAHHSPYRSAHHSIYRSAHHSIYRSIYHSPCLALGIYNFYNFCCFYNFYNFYYFCNFCCFYNFYNFYYFCNIFFSYKFHLPCDVLLANSCVAPNNGVRKIIAFDRVCNDTCRQREFHRRGVDNTNHIP